MDPTASTPREVVLLGSTGSIGTQAVDVARRDPERLRIVGLGASVHEPVQEVGEGIKVAELKDPFGNVLGWILNPLFDPAAVR